METSIYYFSATGNSLHLTHKIANALGNCETIPIMKTNGETTVKTTAPRIGIVFPVFAWGMPRIVEEFVEKLSFCGKPYIFAVATCVAIPGNTLKDLKRSLRQKGADLDAGFTVRAGRSSLMKLNSLDHIIIKLDQRRKGIKSGDERLHEMVALIKKSGQIAPETSSPAANIFGSIFHRLAVRNFKSMDQGFIVGDSCTGCGRCTEICPRSNIVMENGRPIFRHNCELCHACIQWCPNFAIKHPNFDASLKQYRNASIKFTDLVCSEK